MGTHAREEEDVDVSIRCTLAGEVPHEGVHRLLCRLEDVDYLHLGEGLPLLLQRLDLSQGVGRFQAL